MHEISISTGMIHLFLGSECKLFPLCGRQFSLTTRIRCFLEHLYICFFVFCLFGDLLGDFHSGFCAVDSFIWNFETYRAFRILVKSRKQGEQNILNYFGGLDNFEMQLNSQRCPKELLNLTTQFMAG